MKRIKVEISEAKPEQLREFANETLGLNLPPNTLETTLRARITAAHDKTFITVKDEEEPTAQVGPKPKPVTAAQEDPPDLMVKVYINQTEEPGGSDPVKLSCNGSAMLVPRGKDVLIHVKFVEILRNATQMKYEPLADGGLSEGRKVPLYPFSILSPVPENWDRASKEELETAAISARQAADEAAELAATA